MADAPLSLEQKQAADTSLTDYFRAALGEKLVFTLEVQDHYFAQEDVALGLTFQCHMTARETTQAERALQHAIHCHPVLNGQEYSIGVAKHQGATTGIMLMVKAPDNQALSHLVDELATPVPSENVTQAKNPGKANFTQMLEDAGNIARYHGIF